MASEKDITYPPAEAADNSSTSGNPQSQQHVDETLAQLEDPSSTQLSIRAILQGNATHPLTAFEKKAALINVELDSFGLGRYQICIWFLCGFGYFLDLAWSQGVGLAATAIYQEMNVPDGQTGKIYSLANAGLAVGAFSWGILVDIIGRKWAFNLTCLITSVFGLILVCSSSPYICRYMYIYIYLYSHILTTFVRSRQLPSSTTTPSAAYTSSHPSVSVATSPSMPPLPSNTCLKTAETWSRCYRSGSPSASSSPLPWHMAPQRNPLGAATTVFHPA